MSMNIAHFTPSNQPCDLNHSNKLSCMPDSKPSVIKKVGLRKNPYEMLKISKEVDELSDETRTAVKSPVSPRPHQQYSLNQHAVFTLKYLPRLMAEADVLEKLKLFGEVLYLRFMPETEIQGKKDWKSHFKRAEFAFVEKQAESSFQKVRRVRIKGLQVKIVQDGYVGPVEQPAENCFWSYGLNNTKNNGVVKIKTSVPSEIEISHQMVKPTSKFYNSTIKINSNNYRFNVRC